VAIRAAIGVKASPFEPFQVMAIWSDFRLGDFEVEFQIRPAP